jgi:catechol 2,3-dioxygenase-like lactoylglutathione lyase family enzyme
MMAADTWTAAAMMPTLGVSDLDDAVAYYRGLGFEELWRYPEGSQPTHVGMRFGEVAVMLALASDGEPRIDRQNIYFIMKNVAGFHESLRPVFGKDLPSIVESDYGMRDFALSDPWGHLLTFGEEC